MLVAGFFQEYNNWKKEMNKQFKNKGYTLKEKRFVINQVLGYLPNIKDMTITEMEQVVEYLKRH